MTVIASTFFIILLELIILVILCIAGGIAAFFGVPFKFFFFNGAWAFLLPFLMLAYGFLFERNIYRIKQTEIVSECLPPAFDGYKIVQISDLHLSSFQCRTRGLARAVRKVNTLDADAVLYTGDVVTVGPEELNPKLSEVLSGLKARDGVYSILGNHDYCPYFIIGGKLSAEERAQRREKAIQEVIEKEKAMGWKMLLNENVNIERGEDTISIVGVRNISVSLRFQSDGDLDKAMEGARGSYRILMSHDPSHWRAGVVGRDDVNLMLSGHTHAMQFTFFGLWSPCKWVYKEYSGLYERSTLRRVSRNAKRRTNAADEQYLYVNIGLGETGIPIRICARPEITLITLRRNQHD